jgi:glycosyltransferase involved in cell wall biosynthesis
LIKHDRNQGKGAAIRTAIEHASGDFCVIQDSDLEYDPREYGKLLKPLLEGVADAVYGSRFMACRRASRPLFLAFCWKPAAYHSLQHLC